LTDTDSGEDVERKVEQLCQKWWIGLIDYVKRKMSQRKTKKQNETPSDKAARRTAIATIWMAIFTFVLAFTSGLTIWILKNQLKEMRDSGTQTDRIIAADERIAIAIEASLGQAKIAFDAANKQAILSQRAWLHVLVQTQAHTNGQPFVVGEPLEIRATTKNTGRTPAINIKSVTKRDVTARDAGGKFLEPPFVYRDADYVFNGNLTPDGSSYGDFVKPFTSTDLDRIISQKVRMYVHGRVEYDDVFGANHWINFCTFLLPTGAWATCPDHNEMDQNPN